MVRAVVGAWLALHGLTIAILPVLDAATVHGEVVAHVEDGSGSGCPPVHGPSDCAICKVISTPMVASAAVQPLPTITASEELGGALSAAVSAARSSGPSSRGPPTA